MLLRLALTLLISVEIIGTVIGHCGRQSIHATTDWFACLKRDENGNCPFAFEKVVGTNSFGRNYYCDQESDLVCCKIDPHIYLEISGVPCLDEPCNDREAKTKKKKNGGLTTLRRVLGLTGQRKPKNN